MSMPQADEETSTFALFATSRHNSRIAYGNDGLIKLSVWIEKDYGLHLLESPLSKDQQVCEEKRHYRINATVVDSAMLDGCLRGLGTL